MPDASAESNRDVATPQRPTTLPPPQATAGSVPPAPSTAGGVANPGLIRSAPLRAGQFTVGWQIMVAASWTASCFAFAAVWKTSQELGIGTWWLGPRAQPQPAVVRAVPFALALFVCVLAVYNVRHTAWISATASIGIAVGAAFDVSRSGGLAAIEFTIAGSMLLVSLGAALGAERAARPADRAT